MCCWVVDHVVNGAQCDPRTNIKFTRQNYMNSADQLLPRPSFHPIARGPGTQGAFCINLFRLSRYSENPHPRETRRELLDEKNSVAIAKKRFNEQKIGLMLFQQLTHRSVISCQPAQRVARVAPDDCSDPFPRDRAVVSDNDSRLSRRDRVADRPHSFSRPARRKRSRCHKNCVEICRAKPDKTGCTTIR